jgi:DNA-binding LacI/PurR family transcriptional regulator
MPPAGSSRGTAGGRIRLTDVAERAGVTKSIASRVLNDSPGVSVRRETRRRILQAAEDLGYRAHVGARALAAAEARALALTVPDLTNPTYSRISRGAYQRARERGYALLIAEGAEQESGHSRLPDLVSAGRVDGLLVASAGPRDRIVSQLEERGVPHVFVNRAVPGSGRNVTMDVAAASARAVAHLRRLGHRRIGHIAGPTDIVPARARETGFREACREAGLKSAPVARGPFSEEGGCEATLRFFSRHRDVSALYISTLTQAIGALRGLHSLDLRVPDDVSVVAFDDLPLAAYLDPPLTTIAMPLVQLGEAATDALLEQLAGRPSRDVVVPTEPRVVERSSTSPRSDH